MFKTSPLHIPPLPPTSLLGRVCWESFGLVLRLYGFVFRCFFAIDFSCAVGASFFEKTFRNGSEMTSKMTPKLMENGC